MRISQIRSGRPPARNSASMPTTVAPAITVLASALSSRLSLSPVIEHSPATRSGGPRGLTVESIPPRVEVVGVPVDTLTMAQVVATIVDWTDSTTVHVAVGVNAHVCNQAAADRVLCDELAAADLTYADGQSIVWAARFLGRTIPERVATTDLIHPLAAACALRDKKFFLYGGAPGVAEQAAARLEAGSPGLRTETHDGFVSEQEMELLIREINDSGADILLVGLGDPLQQRWVSLHRDELTIPAVLTCGGLFDWTSGAHRRAPLWMIESGFEWLWRLAIEPRRLAKRYLLGNPAFVMRLCRDIIHNHRSISAP